MVFSILVIFFIVAAAAGVLWLVVSQRQDNVVEWIGESWKSVKEEEENSSHYSVEMRDANIGEIFSAFERGDSPAYYTPEQVEDQWNKVVEAERSAVSHIRARFQHGQQDDIHDHLVYRDEVSAGLNTHDTAMADTNLEANSSFGEEVHDTHNSGNTRHEEEPPSFPTVRFA